MNLGTRGDQRSACVYAHHVALFTTGAVGRVGRRVRVCLYGYIRNSVYMDCVHRIKCIVSVVRNYGQSRRAHDRKLRTRWEWRRATE